MFPHLFLTFFLSRFALSADYTKATCNYDVVNCPSTATVSIPANKINDYSYCECKDKEYQITITDLNKVTSFSIPSNFFVYSRISSITIPKECNSINKDAFYGTTIKTLNFQANSLLSSIGSGAFGEVTFTNTLTLPRDMTTISGYAFHHATFNSGFNLPTKLTTINDYAFQFATFSEDLSLPSELTTISEGAFYSSLFKKAVTFEGTSVSLRTNAFQGATFTGSLSLPTSLTSISNAFDSATFESTLSVPSTVTTIYSSAFKSATFKNTLKLPNDLASIYSNAFQNAVFKEALKLPTKIKSIAASVFQEATFEKTLTVSIELVSIGQSAFQEATLKQQLSLPLTLETLSSYAFKDANIKSIVFNNKKLNIQGDVFNGAHFTDTLKLPTNLQKIASSTFSDTIFDNSIVLPASLVEIGNNAFSGARIQNVFQLPASLKIIGEEAFSYSHITISLDLRPNLEIISESAFSRAELTVSGNSKALYSETIDENAFNGASTADFKSITSKYIQNYAFANCLSLVAKEGITILSDGTIGEGAFLNCYKLSGKLTVNPESDPENIKSTIGKYAFKYTGLEFLNLPHMKSIDTYAFSNCVSLTAGPSSPERSNNELYVDSISDHAFDGDTKLKFGTIRSTSIGPYAFRYCRILGSNIILLNNDDLESSIGEYSFYSCDNLGNLTFNIDPNVGQFTISQYAFSKSGLSRELVIPYNVKEIAKYAFANCQKLTKVEFQTNYLYRLDIDDHAFYQSRIGDNLIIPAFVMKVDSYAFASTSIKSLTIEGTNYVNLNEKNGQYEDSPTVLGLNAFFDCRNLNSLKFGEGKVKYATDKNSNKDVEVFRGCPIKSLNLGNVNIIPDNAYIGMESLDQAIVIPDSVTSIGSHAFSECINIPSITISEKSQLTEIGVAAFYRCEKIESIVIPSKVITIEPYSFFQCSNLKTITILSHIYDNGQQVIKFGDYAFYGCSSLTGTLTLPEGLTTIGESAFQGCTNLSGTLTFPNSLKKIDDKAFMGCSSLSGGLEFNADLTEIGKYAFANCSGLDGNLHLVDRMSKDNPHPLLLHDGAFYGCSGLTGDLRIPVRCLLEYLDGLDDKGHELYKYSVNVFKGCSGFDGQLIIPHTITKIPAGTFCDCSNLKGEIKDDLELIGNEAFRNCYSLTGSIDLRKYDYTNHIGSYAFYNCTGLNGQLLFGELSDTESIIIGEYSFYNCHNLTGPLNCSCFLTVGKYAFAGCKGLSGPLIFGVTLHRIGEYAFADCNQFSGTLSLRSPLESQLSIEQSAFSGCTGFKKGTLLIIMDRSKVKAQGNSDYHLKIEKDAFKGIKFDDIRYIGRQQPDCDCDIGIPSRKGIHTSSNYEGKKFCGNPLHKSKLSGGAIAGIVIAVIVVVAVIVFLVVFFLLKKKGGLKSEGEVEMNQDP